MKKIRKNQLVTNMFSYLILQIVTLFVGVVLPRLYLAIYGSEVNGIISTINSFITYFSYIEAGLGLSLIHSLYKPLGQNDSDGIDSILSFSKKQYQKISYIYFSLIILFSVIFPLFSKVNNLTHIEFVALIFVIGFYGAFDFYTMAKYRVLLTADKKEYVISYAMIVAQVLRFVFTWILLQFDISVVLVKIVPVITLLIRSIILKIYVEKKYPNLTFKSSNPPDILTTKNRWDALLLQISINTSTALPVLVVSQTLGYKQANVYAVYSMVIGAVIAVVSSLSSGVAPLFGRKIALKQNVRNIYQIYELGVAFVLTWLFSVCACMILPFINLYVSVVNDVNYIFASYAILFSLWGALHSFRIPATAIINAAALYRENRVTNITNLALQIVFATILAFLFGINGVLVAMIVAALHRNISMALIIERQLIPKTFVKSILYQTVMCFIVIVAYCCSSMFVGNEHITIMRWITMAILSTAVVFVVGAIVYLLVDFKTTKEFIRMLKSKLLNK